MRGLYFERWVHRKTGLLAMVNLKTTYQKVLKLGLIWIFHSLKLCLKSNFIFIIILIGLSSCIKPYVPQYKDTSVLKYVVEGMVSSEEGIQEVRVSKSSSANIPIYNPIGDCKVKIVDEVGQEFDLFELNNGIYQVWMEQDELVVGRSYKVVVETPEGNILESEFDQMPSGAELNIPSYFVEVQAGQQVNEWKKGLQFYIDLEGSEQNSKFYRWQLIETWEYHSAYPVEFYYDGQVQQVYPPDYSEMYCWTTDQVDQIFTLNTTNFSSNAIQKFPLHFIENNSSRLGVLYSLLINQMALSEDAYIYWDQLRQNMTDQGGLYATQPLAVKGNIKNLTSPEQDVLGFFQASYVSSIRVFVPPPADLELTFTDKCSPTPLEHGFIEIRPRNYPAYLLTVDGEWTMTVLNDECVKCTLRGGTTEKPEFWPEEDEK